MNYEQSLPTPAFLIPRLTLLASITMTISSESTRKFQSDRVISLCASTSTIEFHYGIEMTNGTRIELSLLE